MSLLQKLLLGFVTIAAFLGVFFVGSLYEKRHLSGADLSLPSLAKFIPGKEEVVRTDLSYGDDPLQTMEIYARPDQVSAPVIMIVHGGAEGEGDKSHMRDLAGAVTKQGYTAVLPNYRYGGVPSDKQSSHDVMCAAAAFEARAEEYHVNPKAFIVAGFSHGGYVSSLAVLNQEVNWLEGCAVEAPPHIAGFITIASNYGSPHTQALWDLLGISSEEEAMNRYQDIAAARDGAINYIDAHDPPTLILHGTADPKFNELRAKDLEAVLRAAGVPVWLEIIEGGTHTSRLLFEKQVHNDLQAFLTRVFQE